MFDFLYHLSDLYIFLFLSGITLGISLVFIFILKFGVLKKLRYRDNEVIGSIAALIGLIYGVLAGLLALYLLNNNNYATDAVQKEGSVVLNLYRDSRWLKEPTRSTVQTAIQDYIRYAINHEWPLMTKGEALDQQNDFTLEKISDTLRNYSITNSLETAVMTDLLSSLSTLYIARNQRIQMSHSALGPEIWEVILIGTILIIGINYLYRVNFYLHLIAVCAFSIIASCMLFLLVTLDRPFQGEFIVEPDALRSALKFIEKNNS